MKASTKSISRMATSWQSEGRAIALFPLTNLAGYRSHPLRSNFYYTTIYAICQEKIEKNIAQIIFLKFVRFAYCFFSWLVVYYNHRGARFNAGCQSRRGSNPRGDALKNSPKKNKKTLKKLLTNGSRYDIIITERRKEGT